MSAMTGRRLVRALDLPTTKGTAAAGKIPCLDSNTNLTGVTLTNANLITPTINGAINKATITASGSTLALTNANSGTILLNATTGSTDTLPAATGSGISYRFIVTAAAPSGPHVIKVANASDFMIGIITTVDSATVTGYVAANSGTVATNSDTITLSATTTGGLSVGAYVTVVDIAANTWFVEGQTSSSGTAATPFSAGV